MRKVSKKRAAQLRIYTRLRAEYLNDNYMCEVCGFKGATDVHHIKGRYGDRLNDVDHFLAVDRLCHQRIHNDPRWARKNLYLI